MKEPTHQQMIRCLESPAERAENDSRMDTDFVTNGVYAKCERCQGPRIRDTLVRSFYQHLF